LGVKGEIVQNNAVSRHIEIAGGAIECRWAATEDLHAMTAWSIASPHPMSHMMLYHFNIGLRLVAKGSQSICQCAACLGQA